MKIGILGTGDVGRALGKGFISKGHEVKMGSRDAANEKMAAWVAEQGASASGGTFQAAASFGEILVLATCGRRPTMSWPPPARTTSMARRFWIVRTR